MLQCVEKFGLIRSAGRVAVARDGQVLSLESYHLLVATPAGSRSQHQLDPFTAVAASSWTAFLSYMFCAPLYLAGPIVTAQDYYQQVASLAASSCGSSSSSSTKGSIQGMTVAAAAQQRSWALELTRLFGLISMVELARHTFYAPDTVLPHHDDLW